MLKTFMISFKDATSPSQVDRMLEAVILAFVGLDLDTPEHEVYQAERLVEMASDWALARKLEVL